MFVKRFMIIALYLFVIFITGNSKAEKIDNALAVYGGVSIFNNPVYDSTVLVEFPFSINRSDFNFFSPDSTDSNLYARIFAQINLMNSEGIDVDSVRTYFSVMISSYEEALIEDYRIFNKLMIMVKPGVYSARLTVIDVVSKNHGEYFFDTVEVKPIEKDNISIGGICLAYDIKYIGENNPDYNPRLDRNGFKIIVNPVSIYADSDTIIYLYGEIYNLKYSASNPSEYQLSLTIFDNNENIYQSLGSRFNQKAGNSAVITESFSIDGWHTGSYKLQIAVVDHETKKTDTAYIPFHIISTEALLLDASTRLEIVDPYDSLSIDDKINLVKYFLSLEQKRTLFSLSDSGKINFLNQYWKEHDENPGTDIIENRIEIIRRYRYCNQFYSSNDNKTNGWSSDRGRIYITYGPWDERDDYQTPREGNPYEIWYYRSYKEGKLFIFEDWTGTEDYRLVHSNVYGEIYNKDWQDRINRGYIDFVE